MLGIIHLYFIVLIARCCKQIIDFYVGLCKFISYEICHIIKMIINLYMYLFIKIILYFRHVYYYILFFNFLCMCASLSQFPLLS
jgi:hypothetical protein